MSIKVGINGFGRHRPYGVPRQPESPRDRDRRHQRSVPADYLAYMLKYDTMHGRCEAEIGYTENAIAGERQGDPCLC